MLSSPKVDFMAACRLGPNELMETKKESKTIKTVGGYYDVEGIELIFGNTGNQYH